MIIDSHAHWLPKEIIENAHFFHKGWNDIESQAQMMEAAGIDKAVLTYPTSDAHLKLGSLKEVSRIYNDNVASIIKRYPQKFLGAAILPAPDTQAMLEELKRSQDLGFKAVSLASSYNGVYLDDKAFLPIYEKARADKLPIFVHSQIVNPIGYERLQDPLLTPVIEYIFDTTVCVGKMLMSGVLRDFADVKFVFAYFGGVTCHIAHRYEATYQMLRGINFVKDLGGKPQDFLKNIYVDTSGDVLKTNFLSALDALGAGHILWGSDWPAKKDTAASINAVKSLDISEADKNNILGGNLEKLLAL
jgi:aminocarboxymuconate-semialdehyde decarboxylase